MDVENPLQNALDELYEAARFLKRVNVTAYAVPLRGLVVSLEQGSIEDWNKFWACLLKVGYLKSPPAEPTKRLPQKTPRPTWPKPPRERL